MFRENLISLRFLAARGKGRRALLSIGFLVNQHDCLLTNFDGQRLQGWTRIRLSRKAALGAGGQLAPSGDGGIQFEPRQKAFGAEIEDFVPEGERGWEER
jgi:hypothetical protein